MINYPFLFTRKFSVLFCIVLLVFLAGCKKDVLDKSNVVPISSGTGSNLYDVIFVDDHLGYCVGGERYFQSDLLTTNDGGFNWDVHHMDDAQKAVYSVCHFNGRIYAAGLDGKIMIKKDKFSEWSYVQTAVWEVFQGISFATDNKGFVVSAKAFDTGFVVQIDSLGNVVDTQVFRLSLSDVVFYSDQIGYICGYGAILKTEDGGNNWNFLNVRGDYFKSLFCINEKVVWSVGYNGSVVKSEDGGKTWIKIRNGDNPLLKRYRLRDVLFSDLNTGYIVGDKGLLLKTVDGGNNWIEFDRFTDLDLFAVAKKNNGDIIIVGERGCMFLIK